MRNLRDSVRAYVAMRRGMGYKLRHVDNILNGFVTFLREEKSEFITANALMRYVSWSGLADPGTRSRLLSVVRGFAQYRQWEDPRTEIPPSRLYPLSGRKYKPHIFSRDEIVRIQSTLQHRRSINAMTCHAHWCIFGLLENTGMRLNEVLSLEIQDVDFETGVLEVKKAKFGKTRLVPVHKSTMQVLKRFAALRASHFRPTDSAIFFCNGNGKKCDAGHFSKIVLSAFQRAGVRQRGKKGARVHDLRHTFAVTAIERWYKAGKDVNRLLPILSTYLGHKKISNTYWYLTITPYLSNAAVKLLEASRKGKTT